MNKVPLRTQRLELVANLNNNHSKSPNCVYTAVES